VKTYHVYIMASASRVLYIGVTNDLLRRVREHKEKKVPGFTARYCVSELVYFEAFGDIRVAIAREKQLKGVAAVQEDRADRIVQPTLEGLERRTAEAEPADKNPERFFAPLRMTNLRHAAQPAARGALPDADNGPKSSPGSKIATLSPSTGRRCGSLCFAKLQPK